MTRFPHIPRLSLALALAVTALFVAAAPGMAADMPAVIDRLYKEPTTLFDMGMKRLRAAAFDAAVRTTAPSQRTPLSRVWYRTDTQSIDIRFEIRAGAEPPTERLCQETRTLLVNEIFSIGRTAYAVNLSRAERVRRRLGLIFAHEPLDSGNEVIAVGQRLAELTYVEIVYVDAKGTALHSCRTSLAVSERQ